MTEPEIRYDTIGRGYGNVRREDPVLRARIHAALRDARSVVNVGAGTGSYEPADRYVLAIEPSDVMASQRPPHSPPALRGFADALPLRDRAVDAAMAVMTVHHWDGAQEHGVRELRRVARGPVVIVTIDPRVCSGTWLLADYLPEAAALVQRSYPPPEQLCAWLGGDVRCEPVPVSRDTPDWSILSYWAHPERFLDPDARAATSSIARLPEAVVARAVNALRADLGSGAWERKHGALRELLAFDAGWRVIVAR